MSLLLSLSVAYNLEIHIEAEGLCHHFTKLPYHTKIDSIKKDFQSFCFNYLF